MKVYIGKYPVFIGPYQIAEKLLFWKDKNSEAVNLLGDRLANIDWFYTLCNWWYTKQSRKVKVRIDEQDIWGFDSTLAYIIHPALVKMRDSKMGSPYVDDDDVPEELRSTTAPPKEHAWDIDGNHHKRWEWVLNEMIFVFGIYNTDWEDQFHTDAGFDGDGRLEFEQRIQNGFRLFGKYYSALWT